MDSALSIPIKIARDGGGNYTCLQPMSSAEEYYMAWQMGYYVAWDSSQDRLLELTDDNIGTTLLGTLTDTFFNEPVGTHPGSSITSGSTDYKLYQRNVGTTSEINANWKLPVSLWQDSALGTDSDSLQLWEMHPSTAGATGEINENTMNLLTERLLGIMYTNDYLGTYLLDSANANLPDYVASVPVIFSDTRTDGTQIDYSIWLRKFDSDNTAPSQVFPVHVLRDNPTGVLGVYEGLQEFDSADMQYTFGNFARYLGGQSAVGAGIGEYQLRTSAQGVPTDPGTWVSKGVAIDTKQVDSDEIHENSFGLSYVAEYIQDYEGGELEQYSAEYGNFYVKQYTGVYEGKTYVQYTGAYEGFILIDGGGTYVGNYSPASFTTYNKGGATQYTKAYETLYLKNYEGFYDKAYDASFPSPPYIGSGEFSWYENPFGAYTRNYGDTYSTFGGFGIIAGYRANVYDGDAPFGQYVQGEKILNYIGSYLGYAEYGDFYLEQFGGYVGTQFIDFVAYQGGNVYGGDPAYGIGISTKFGGMYQDGAKIYESFYVGLTGYDALFFETGYAPQYVIQYEGTYLKGTNQYTKEYTKLYTQSYDTQRYSGGAQYSRSVQYSGQYSKGYDRNFTGQFNRQYIVDYIKQYEGFYTHIYDKIYTKDYGVLYTGEYEGLTISTKVQTIETYTLYVRVAA